MVPSHGLEGKVVVLNHLRRPDIVAGVGGVENQVYSDGISGESVAKTVFGRVTERLIRFRTRAEIYPSAEGPELDSSCVLEI
jgi:hypothetical protein